MICDGCGQSAISTTKAGRPICPDCIDEGYGDECPEPAIADERHAAGYQAAIDDVVAMIRVHVSEVADDNSYWGGPHQRAEWRASEVIDEITRRFGKGQDHG